MLKIAKKITTDILVIGGGGAACTASIAAARNGASVALVCKGKTGNSGNTIMIGGSYGMDGESAANDYHIPGADPSFTREDMFRSIVNDGFNLSDQRLVQQFVDDSPSIVYEVKQWGEELGVATVGELNELITGKTNKKSSCRDITDLILVQEALMEKRMAQIADAIAKDQQKKIILIAGPSSSGKTTFSYRLSVQLKAAGLRPHPIGVDNYFVDREKSPKDADGNYNYEDLECIDVAQFNQDMEDLLQGKTVSMPTYNFVTGRREYKGNFLRLGPEDILVIEGIHCLNEKLYPLLPKESIFRIYISALTQLNIDEHNRIPTTDGRLIRRMVRDARTRGASAQDTIAMWNNVRKGEEKNIFPYQETADVVFNSALIYELAVLKPYAEPLLFGIDRNAPEYSEAKRLLKFFDYFVGIDSQKIPINSILREFIGGSCFNV